MIDLQTFSLSFFAEATLGLAVVLGVVLHAWLQGQRRERQAAGRLIDQLQQATPEHSEDLQQLLEGFGHLPPERQESLIAELLSQEKALYQHILQLFLSRDPRRLSQLEGRIRALQEPYRQLLQELPAGSAPPPSPAPAAPEAGEDEVRALRAEVEQLAAQLQTALETIDTLSSEYTRMFAPDRSREELEASRRRILETLKRNEARLHPLPATAEDDDLIITEESP